MTPEQPLYQTLITIVFNLAYFAMFFALAMLVLRAVARNLRGRRAYLMAAARIVTRKTVEDDWADQNLPASPPARGTAYDPRWG